MDKNLFSRLLTYLIYSAVFVVVFQISDMLFAEIGFNTNLRLFEIIIPAIISFALLEVTYASSNKSIFLQKNNLKLQLFDKRYKIFEAIADSEAIIKNDHALSQSLQRIEGEKESIQKRLLAIRESLIKSERLSQAVFDKALSDKVHTARVKFDEVIFDHLKFLDMVSSDENEMLKSFVVFCTDIQKPAKEMIEKETHKIEIDPEFIETHAEILSLITRFNKRRLEYSQWLKSSGIMVDFYSYLSINDLDK